MKKRKYKNIPVIFDGIKFDSKKEALRYRYLKHLEDTGKISDLRLQVPFDLIPTVKHGERTLKRIIYKADFVYIDDGKTIVEDVKGMETEVFKIKMRLFLLRYPDVIFRLT